MYTRLEQARFRLVNSVVLLNDEPFYIVDARFTKDYKAKNDFWRDHDQTDVSPKSIEIVCDPLPKFSRGSKIPETKYFTLNEVEIKQPRLGFGVYPIKNSPLFAAKPSFFSRLTVRNNRYGVTGDNTRQVTVGANDGRLRGNFLSCALRSAILADLPSAKDALELFSGNLAEEDLANNSIIPVARNYALGIDKFERLYVYKDIRRIGSSDDGENFSLLPEFTHFREELIEETKGVINVKA